MGVSPTAATGDTHDLAVALGPVLRSTCGGRLGELTWFRSKWQRGGAATGYSTWKMSNGRTIDVFVKLPVAYVEYRWTTELGHVEEADWDAESAVRLPVARVVAHGVEVGGYDLAWIITERLAGPALAANVDQEAIADLLEAAAEFQVTAMKIAPLDACPVNPDWDRHIARSKVIAKEGDIPDATRWKDALRKVLRALPLLKIHWQSRPINAWCHGDLHAGNGMRRKIGAAHDPAVLVDLALVHPGHWLEDAIYLERQHWGHADLLHGIKPLSELARLRRERGMQVDDHYPQLANIRRVLMASCAPAMMEREGGKAYLHAALEVLERFLPQVVREFDL